MILSVAVQVIFPEDKHYHSTFCSDILHWLQDPKRLRAKHNECDGWGVPAFPPSLGLFPTALQTPGTKPPTPDTSSPLPCVSVSSCFLLLYIFSFLYLKCIFLLNQHRKPLLLHQNPPCSGTAATPFDPMLCSVCSIFSVGLPWPHPLLLLRHWMAVKGLFVCVIIPNA